MARLKLLQPHDGLPAGSTIEVPAVEASQLALMRIGVLLSAEESAAANSETKAEPETAPEPKPRAKPKATSKKK